MLARVTLSLTDENTLVLAGFFLVLQRAANHPFLY